MDITTIIDYFNNNTFAASIITIIVSTLLSAITTIVINLIDRKINRKYILKDRKREERYNKGEFRIDKYIKGDYNDHLDLIYTDFTPVKNQYGTEDAIYNKKILNYSKLEKITMPLKNIGRKEICQFYITVNDRSHRALFESNRTEFLYKNKCQGYVVGYYNKLLPGESVLVDIHYYKGSKIFGIISQLSIYYYDGYGNPYKHTVFLEDGRVEGPYSIKEKEYFDNTSPVE